MAKELNKPDYLFEVSWEVCNKVGGIYTVIATKSLFLRSQLKRHHILIGPDVWMDTDANPDFHEDPLLWLETRGCQERTPSQNRALERAGQSGCDSGGFQAVPYGD